MNALWPILLVEFLFVFKWIYFNTLSLPLFGWNLSFYSHSANSVFMFLPCKWIRIFALDLLLRFCLVDVRKWNSNSTFDEIFQCGFQLSSLDDSHIRESNNKVMRKKRPELKLTHTHTQPSIQSFLDFHIHCFWLFCRIVRFVLNKRCLTTVNTRIHVIVCRRCSAWYERRLKWKTSFEMERTKKAEVHLIDDMYIFGMRL